jgi:hypothetical protein
MPDSISENQNAPDGDREPEKQPDSPVKQVPSAVAKSELPPSHCEPCKPYKKKRDWFDYGKGVLEIAGLLVLCVYAAYTIKIYCANKKAADAAKSAADTAHDALVMVNRPWIGLESNMMAQEPVKISRDGNNTRLDSKVGFSMRNFGNAPAFYAGVFTTLHVNQIGSTTNTSDFKLEIDQTCKMADPAKIPDRKMGYTLFPGNRIVLSSPINSGSPNPQINTWLTVIGCISYRDEFPDTKAHHTHFCFMSAGAMNGVKAGEQLEPCPEDEDAD